VLILHNTTLIRCTNKIFGQAEQQKKNVFSNKFTKDIREPLTLEVICAVISHMCRKKMRQKKNKIYHNVKYIANTTYFKHIFVVSLFIKQL